MVVKNCLAFMKYDKETIWRVLIVCILLGFYQTICQENDFLTRNSELEHQRLLIYNKENLEQCSQSTPIEDGKFDSNDTMTSLSEKLSSSVIEWASENENQNSSCNDNEKLPDSTIKQKSKQ